MGKVSSSEMAKPRSFFQRYLVTFVMVPSIIGLHLGWRAMQKNRTLVKEHEEIDIPAVTFYKYCLRRLSNEEPKVEKANAKADNNS